MLLYFFDPISNTIHYHNRDIELLATTVLEEGKATTTVRSLHLLYWA
jgi:hypothetical protein